MASNSVANKKKKKRGILEREILRCVKARKAVLTVIIRKIIIHTNICKAIELIIVIQKSLQYQFDLGRLLDRKLRQVISPFQITLEP